MGNRLARVLEKEGQRDRARHAFALAVAAGGAEVSISRDHLLKLAASAEAADKEVAEAAAELVTMRTVKLPSLPDAGASAQFGLIFDASNKPERVEWMGGTQHLRAAADRLREQAYQVKFPDVSSIKIVRKATLSCDAAACSVVLAPLEGLQPSQNSIVSGPVQH